MTTNQIQLNSFGASMLLFFLLFTVPAYTQSYEKLVELKGFETKVYFSKGHEARAKEMAMQCQKAIQYNHQLLNFKPEVTLLVLSPADWPIYTKFPVYGMPHYTNEKILVVATEDNDFWKSFIPPMADLPMDLVKAVKGAYSTQDGKLSMQPFFDLLAIHELGHAYHLQAKLNIQRKWMGELFCNIFLHTFIAENDPSRLQALTVFPNMVVASGTAGYTYTSLNEFESNYWQIGQKHPKNYGWYQCRFHAAAAAIYDTGGKSVLQNLWTALSQQKENMTDEQLTTLLVEKVHQSVANVFVNWEKNNAAVQNQK